MTCYNQRSILTVLYVVCYQSVTRNSNNSSGYVYNREFITQPTLFSHDPRPLQQIKIVNLTVGFFSQTHVSGGVFKKYFSEYYLCYLHSRCLQSFTSELFVIIS